MNKRVILAYSGGLDTTYCILYLIEKGYEVYTAFVNTGANDENDLKMIKERALSLGSNKHFNVNAENKFFNTQSNLS
ncbi:MAG: argininosuccinate synthase [Ignavibacteria bacterium]|nr:argininosuccinate synthase [Ignavibacteria bacterium]